MTKEIPIQLPTNKEKKDGYSETEDLEKISNKLAKNNGDKSKTVGEIIEIIEPLFQNEKIIRIINDPGKFKESLRELSKINSEDEFKNKLLNNLKPLLDFKQNNALDFAQIQERNQAKEYEEEGGGIINDVVYYGIDKEEKSLHFHIFTTKIKDKNGNEQKTEGLTRKEKISQFTEALIKLKEIIRDDETIENLRGSSEIVPEYKGMLETLGFIVETAKETKIIKINDEEREVPIGGRCEINRERILDEKFTDLILEMRKKYKLDKK